MNTLHFFARPLVFCCVFVSWFTMTASSTLSAGPAPPARGEARPYTVASLKLIPRPGDKAGNFARFEHYAREAAAGGAQLIVTSECYLDGYLGNRKIHPEMTPERLAEIAEPVDGPYLRKAAALARELSVYVVFGFSERRGDRLFNSAAVLTPDGELAGVYSKSHTGGIELYEEGRDFPVFDTACGRLGLLICFDRQFPETSRLLALEGAELIVIPAHSSVVEMINEDLMMRVRAYENNVFVVFASPFNTLVTDPDGEIIARNGERDAEGIVYARIDLSRRDPDRGALVHRRPEVYGDLVKVGEPTAPHPDRPSPAP